MSHRTVVCLCLVLSSLTLAVSSPGNGGPTTSRFSSPVVSALEEGGVAGIRDVNGDGLDDYVVGHPGALGGNGQIFCLSGADNSVIWFRSGATDAEFGRAVASSQDIDGDGIDDVLCGSPGYLSGRGRVYVLSGVSGATIRTLLGGVGEGLGFSVADAGDTDGDGFPDQIAGAPTANTATGLARLYSGVGGAVLHTFLGENNGDRFGYSVAGGFDLGGDGRSDVVIGAPFADFNGTSAGRVYTFYGFSGVQIFTEDGDGTQDQFGAAVTVMASGEGYARGYIAVGAPEPGSNLGIGAGPGYVRILGRPGALWETIATLTGSAVGDRFGAALAPCDLNQEGRGDLVVGATQAGGFAPVGPGYVRAFEGGTLTQVFEAAGITNGDRFGFAVAAGIDADGDGREDLVALAPCVGAGEATVLQPPVPPAFGRILITEVSWGDPDAVEITNFSDVIEDLTGWELAWYDAGAPRVAPLAGTLAPGASMVVVEIGGVIPGAPANAVILTAFPSIGTTTGAVTVTLRHRSGPVVDGVRIESAGGVHGLPGRGERFRGLAQRVAGSDSVERILGLDSNSGADWTSEQQTSWGRPNLSAGPRGTDPIPTVSVLINEVDDSPDYVELLSTGAQPVNLQHWFFVTSANNGASLTAQRPFVAPFTIGHGEFVVVGDTASLPPEMPLSTQYVDLSLVSGGNLPFVANGWSLGLFDSYGRSVDQVRSNSEAGPVPHNTPRVGSAWQDFVGAAPRTMQGARAVGRVDTIDTNDGADWRAELTRSMGLSNPGANFVGPVGGDDVLDARLEQTGLGGVTMILNAGPAAAGNAWFLLFSLGHLDGNGPFVGLAPEAANFFLSGVLSPSGAARFDIDDVVAPGLELDTRVFMVSPQGALRAISGILELDT